MRQRMRQMMRASMIAELSKSKDPQSKKHRLTQALFDLYEAHDWELDNKEAEAETQRIYAVYMEHNE